MAVAESKFAIYLGCRTGIARGADIQLALPQTPRLCQQWPQSAGQEETESEPQRGRTDPARPGSAGGCRAPAPAHTLVVLARLKEVAWTVRGRPVLEVIVLDLLREPALCHPRGHGVQQCFELCGS